MSSIASPSASLPVWADEGIFALISQVIPLEAIATIADTFRRPGQRRRKLPIERVLLLLIVMSLRADCALATVAEYLWLTLGWVIETVDAVPPTKGAITQARKRVGVRPIVGLFHQVCHPLGTTETPGVFYAGYRLLALDWTEEEVPDTPANAAYFGRRRLASGPAAFPQALLITLIECGTRVVLGGICWPCRASGPAAGRRLLRSVPPQSLLLWDRGFQGIEMLRACWARGIMFLGRITSQMDYPVWQVLPDGSYLSHAAGFTRAQCPADQTDELIRVLVYTITDPTRPGHGEQHRLVTSLLDHRRHPARVLVALYHERWEIELTIDEIDTHQRVPRHPLRSKTPQGILQEVYGLWLAHYVVRATICASAQRAGYDPDRVSFSRTHRLVVTILPVFGLLPPERRAAAWQHLLAALAQRPLPRREDRTNPRVVKKRCSKFQRKPPNTRCDPPHSIPFDDAIAILAPPAPGPPPLI